MFGIRVFNLFVVSVFIHLAGQDFCFVKVYPVSFYQFPFSVYDRARTLMFKEECPFQISIVSDDRNKIYSRDIRIFKRLRIRYVPQNHTCRHVCQ